MGRKRTACDRCAGIKTVCNKELPCSRCKRLCLPCKYYTVKEADVDSNSQTRKGKIRAGHKRSPNGCTSCLTRRKKCDEQLPVCSDCKRLGLSCVPRGSKAREFSSPQKSSEVSSPDSVFHQIGASQKDTQIEGYDNRGNIEEAFKIQSELDLDLNLRETAPYLDWINLIDNDSSKEVPRRENLNESSAMVVLPEARVSDDVPSLGTMLSLTALNNITGVTSEALNEWSVGEKHLLNHFQQVVSRALVVVDDDENPFLVDIVPMALAYHPVRHSLVALSACHLSKVYSDFERNVLRHRSLALQGLKADLDNPERIESALATTLLLCLLEICEGNSRKWILHLHGARALISGFESKVIRYPLSFLFELYDFLCCVTTITSNMSPVAPDTALNSSVIICTRPRRRGIHPLFGIARNLYTSLNSINKLAARRRTSHESMVDTAMFSSEARDIELSLQGWTPPDEPNDARELREVTAAALAIQWAALMRLQQVMHGNAVSDRKVQTAVENILSALSIIRPGSQVEAHILFPLFMAGVGSTTKANRLTVEYRLNIMETTVGFGNITGAHKLLDSIWQRMNEGERFVDWELLMQKEYAGVVLL